MHMHQMTTILIAKKFLLDHLLTVWKFKGFPMWQILREIKFGETKQMPIKEFHEKSVW